MDVAVTIVIAIIGGIFTLAFTQREAFDRLQRVYSRIVLFLSVVGVSFSFGINYARTFKPGPEEYVVFVVIALQAFIFVAMFADWLAGQKKD